MLQKYGSNILVINKMTALKDLSLVARATIFTELLGRCKFTAMDQTIFQLEEGVGYLFNKLISLRRESRNLYLIGNGENKVYLEADTLLMNLTSGFNSNLEKKTSAD